MRSIAKSTKRRLQRQPNRRSGLLDGGQQGKVQHELGGVLQDYVEHWSKADRRVGLGCRFRDQLGSTAGCLVLGRGWTERVYSHPDDAPRRSVSDEPGEGLADVQPDPG